MTIRFRAAILIALALMAAGGIWILSEGLFSDPDEIAQAARRQASACLTEESACERVAENRWPERIKAPLPPSDRCARPGSLSIRGSAIPRQVGMSNVMLECVSNVGHRYLVTVQLYDSFMSRRIQAYWALCPITGCDTAAGWGPV